MDLRQRLSALLPPEQVEEEVGLLSQELPRLEASFQPGQGEIAGLTALIKMTPEQAPTLQQRPWFQRLWSRLTHSLKPQDQQHALRQVQARALLLLEQLLRLDLWQAEAGQILGARTELLALRSLALKSALVQMGQALSQRMERSEDRLTRLEQRGDALERRLGLVEIFQSDFSPGLQRPYEEISGDLPRFLQMIQDFIDASGGAWRPLDLQRLKLLLARQLPSEGFQLSEVLREMLSLAQEGQALRWLGARGLRERLMAPLDQGEGLLRGFYPLHYLLLRPGWYLDQGLPLSMGHSVISQELESYGIEAEQRLPPSAWAEFLLEERLAWDLESSAEAPLALPAPRNLRAKGLAIQQLFLLSDQVLALGYGRRSTRPTLFLLSEGEEPWPLPEQPPLPSFRLGTWSAWGDQLFCLNEDHIGVDVLRSEGGRWLWRSLTLGPRLEGISTGPRGLLAWRGAELYQEGVWSEQPAALRAATGLIQGSYIAGWEEGAFLGEPPQALPGPPLSVLGVDRPAILLRGVGEQLQLYAREEEGWQRCPIPVDEAQALPGRFLIRAGRRAWLWIPGQDLKDPLSSQAEAVGAEPQGRLALYEAQAGRVVLRWP